MEIEPQERVVGAPGQAGQGTKMVAGVPPSGACTCSYS